MTLHGQGACRFGISAGDPSPWVDGEIKSSAASFSILTSNVMRFLRRMTKRRVLPRRSSEPSPQKCFGLTVFSVACRSNATLHSCRAKSYMPAARTRCGIRKLLRQSTTETQRVPVNQIDFPSLPAYDRSPPLARARQHIPTLSPSLLDTLSGVEVQFFRPSLGANTGDVDAGPSGFEAGSQEDDLLRRLRDELKLEATVRARDDENAAGWDDRLNKLKEFKTTAGSVSTSTAAPVSRSEIGTPPDLGDLEREVRRRQKREAKKGGRVAKRTASDSESDETASSSEEENESGSDDEDSDGAS